MNCPVEALFLAAAALVAGRSGSKSLDALFAAVSGAGAAAAGSAFGATAALAAVAGFGLLPYHLHNKNVHCLPDQPYAKVGVLTTCFWGGETPSVLW